MRKESIVTTLVILVAIAIGVGLVFGFIKYDQKNNATDTDATDSGQVSEDDGVLDVPGEVETIQNAIDQAKEGDVVKIAAGTFTDTGENNGVTYGLYVDKAITIEGAGRGETIIDGKDKAMHGVFVADSVDGQVVIKGITIQNFTGNGVEVLNKETEVSDVTITKNGNRGASFRNVSNKSSLHNSIVFDNRFNGVYSEKSAVKIYNNTIYKNGPAGIIIVVTDTDAAGTSPEVYNNIIALHKTYGIFYDHPAFPKQVVVDHNNLFSNKNNYFEELNNEGTKTRTIKPTPGTGELAVDPDFVDLQEFRLPAGSALLKASRDDAELGAYGK